MKNEIIDMNAEGDYEFLDFTDKKGFSQLCDHEFSVFGRDCVTKSDGRRTAPNYSFRLNKADSEHLFASELDRLRLRRDRMTNDLHLIFNREEGMQVKFDKSTRGHVATVTNKQFVEYLAAHYAVEKDANGVLRSVFDITGDLSNSPEYATYRIVGKGRKKKWRG